MSDGATFRRDVDLVFASLGPLSPNCRSWAILAHHWVYGAFRQAAGLARPT